MVLESICCINTSEMGSLKDNKLHRVGRDSQRTGAMLSPQWSLSLMLHWLTYCTHCMHRTGLPSCLGCGVQWSSWITGKPEELSRRLGQNVSLPEHLVVKVTHRPFVNFFKFLYRDTGLKSYSKWSARAVDCSPSHVERVSPLCQKMSTQVVANGNVAGTPIVWCTVECICFHTCSFLFMYSFARSIF